MTKERLRLLRRLIATIMSANAVSAETTVHWASGAPPVEVGDVFEKWGSLK